MSLIIKYSFLICYLFLNISYAQDYLKDQFEFAKDMFNKEDYFDAITEFKRLQYFDSSNAYAFISNALIAQSYKNGGKFNDAIRYFTLAEINSRNKEDLYRIKIEIVRVNILRRSTDIALRLLDSLESKSQWRDKKDEINYWRGWSYIFSDEWDNAAESFSEIINQRGLKIFCEETNEKKYSVTFAKIASLILPGSGQFYTGNYISGLISLGWCALWGYVAVNAFSEDRIFDGLVITNFLWFRFYRGNLQNAEKFAIEKNLKITNEALYYLQNNYTGLKP